MDLLDEERDGQEEGMTDNRPDMDNQYRGCCSLGIQEPGSGNWKDLGSGEYHHLYIGQPAAQRRGLSNEKRSRGVIGFGLARLDASQRQKVQFGVGGAGINW
jgi:hypothetical protein